MPPPELYIITGPNGAGKSTAGPQYLPADVIANYPVFDGDKLFMHKQKELWLAGMRAHKEARKIAYEHVTNTFDELVENALTKHDSFVYEGHFTNDATWDIPKLFKERGYKTNLLFIGLSDPDLSGLRVSIRVKKGGHYVDPMTIKDNFYGNLEKLNIYFYLFDHLRIIDTSTTRHFPIATFKNGEPEFFLPSINLPEWFVKYLPALYQKIASKGL